MGRIGIRAGAFGALDLWESHQPFPSLFESPESLVSSLLHGKLVAPVVVVDLLDPLRMPEACPERLVGLKVHLVEWYDQVVLAPYSSWRDVVPQKDSWYAARAELGQLLRLWIRWLVDDQTTEWQALARELDPVTPAVWA